MGRTSAYLSSHCTTTTLHKLGGTESGDERGDNRPPLESFGRGRPSKTPRGHVQLSAAGPLRLGSADGCASMHEPIEPIAAQFKCLCQICAKAVEESGPYFA